MFPIRTKNRRGITAVLTTIIILVASIVMGASVAVYSTNLFQSGGEQQAIQMQGLRTWVNSTDSDGIGWGAFAVKNTGDKILSVSSIELRGTGTPFTNWYVDTEPARVNPNFQAQFNYTENYENGHLKGSEATGTALGPSLGSGIACTPGESNSTSNIVMQLGPPTTPRLCLAQQNGPVALNPGQSAIIYYRLPDSLLTPTDSGITSTVNILAGNAPVAQTTRIANP